MGHGTLDPGMSMSGDSLVMTTTSDMSKKDLTHDSGEMSEKGKGNELWARMVACMRQRGDVGSYGLDNCISKLSLVEDTGTKLIFEYPKDLPIVWIEMNYVDYIVDAATRVLGASRSIELRVEETEVSETVGSGELPDEPILPGLESTIQTEGSTKATRGAATRKRTAKMSFTSGLNEEYRFDTFVVGDSNEFAYAAARAIVNNMGHLYNPLFIYGASGLGKTHLLQAIGNALRAQDEEVRVLYTTSEDFTNNYINSIASQGKELSNFRSKYRKADVLLIDDIQFLANKVRTQEEFFHTFNALFSSGKQIVLTADCPAPEVTNIDARLTSRFEQGLSVALQAPNYETRLAILRSKRGMGRSELVSDEVLEFLAKHINRSVRRLEGALTRLATFASLSHHRPNITEARSIVRDFLREEPAVRLTIRDIQRCVADEFNVRVADLNGRRRTVGIAHPRQIAMFLARHHTGSSLQDIGAAFGGRDHGTVIHALRTVEKRLDEDSSLRASVDRIMSTLGV